MRALEAQNQALLEAQRVAALAASVSAPQTTMVAPAMSSTPPANAAPTWPEIDWADEPALEPSRLSGTANPNIIFTPQQPSGDSVSARSAGSGTIRSPRELSFQDRDRQQVQVALEQWNGGRQLSALQTLDRFIFDNPEAHHSRETLAKLLIQQGENSRALQAVEMGLRIAPNHNGYRKIKARLLLEQNNSLEASRLLSGSAPPVSADAEYHDLLATAQLSAEQYDSALVSYQLLLQQDPLVGRWWYGLAASLDALGRAQDAAAAYERALQQGNLSAGLRQASQQRMLAIRQDPSAR